MSCGMLLGSGVETEAVNGSKLAPLGADQLGEMGCVAPGAILEDNGWCKNLGFN